MEKEKSTTTESEMEKQQNINETMEQQKKKKKKEEKKMNTIFNEANFIDLTNKLQMLEEKLNEITNTQRKQQQDHFDNSVVVTPSTKIDKNYMDQEQRQRSSLRKRILSNDNIIITNSDNYKKDNNIDSNNNNSGSSNNDNSPYNKLKVITTPKKSKMLSSSSLSSEMTRQQARNYRHVSFSDYLRLEMTGTMNNELTHDTDGALGWQEQQLVVSMLQVPYHVESLMMYGLILATDSFLFVFTYFPLRAIWAIFLLLFKALSMLIPSSFCLSLSEKFSRVHVYLIIRLLILILAAYAIGFMDMSRAYHYIKMLSFMRLYVIFNLLDIFDKLLTALGQDIFDSLHWATQNRPKDRIWSIFFLSIGASVYAITHSALTFSRMVSLNVAINTKDNALLTLLISNNFIELKSSVFKRFQPENVFQIACSDIVERFHILLFLVLIGTEGLRRDGGFENWVYSALTILISEVVVDWLKHAFITKFNRIPLSVYGQFNAVLRHDLTSSRTRSQRKVLDHTHLLSRRLGLPNIPLACVTLRILFLHLSDRSWKFNTWQTCIILSLLFSCMIAFKTLLGLWLLVQSSMKLQAEGFQRLDKGGNYSPTAVSILYLYIYIYYIHTYIYILT